MSKRIGAFTDAGLFVLRVGIGAAFVLHGWPKITGGMKMWEGLGGAMANFGVTFAPAVWGFLAAFSEFVGGIALAIGFLARPFCVLMAFTMLVATVMHVKAGDAFGVCVYPAKMLVVFVALLLMGPGRYTVTRLFRKAGAKG